MELLTNLALLLNTNVIIYQRKPVGQFTMLINKFSIEGAAVYSEATSQLLFSRQKELWAYLFFPSFLFFLFFFW